MDEDITIFNLLSCAIKKLKKWFLNLDEDKQNNYIFSGLVALLCMLLMCLILSIIGKFTEKTEVVETDIMPYAAKTDDDIVYNIVRTAKINAKINVLDVINPVLEGTFKDYELLSGVNNLLDAAQSIKRKEEELRIPKGARTIGLEFEDFSINIYGWGQRVYNCLGKEEKSIHLIIISNENFTESSMGVSSFNLLKILSSSNWTTRTGNVVEKVPCQ